MFSNRVGGELNVRVVLYGPAFVGKSTLMRRIHDEAPKSQRGELFTATVDTDSMVSLSSCGPSSERCAESEFDCTSTRTQARFATPTRAS